MSSVPDWLWLLNTFALGSLVIAVFVWGSVVFVRRWHVCTGARLAGTGFLIAAVSTVAGQLVFTLLPNLLNALGSVDITRSFQVVSALSTLLHVASFLLIVLGLRSTLIELARSHEVVFQPVEND